MNELNASTVFNVANLIALLAWILLIVFPRWRMTRRLVHSGLVSLVLSIFYWAALIVLVVTGTPSGAGFDSLSSVAKLFSSEWGLLAGWVHYLAFDLLVAVEVDSKLLHRNFLIRSTCLILIFMLGPVGWSLSRLATIEVKHA